MAAPMSIRFSVKLNQELSWSHVKRILLYQKCDVRLFGTRHKREEYNKYTSNFPNFHPDERRVCFTPEEQLMKVTLEPNQPHNAKTLRVAIIGDPNVGKSTLINRLLQHKILPVSRKANTTRKNTLLILTQDECQITFVDTPGILAPEAKARHRVPSTVAVDPEKAASEVDLLGVVVDAKDKFRRNTSSKTVTKILHLHRNTPSILILNKVDGVLNKRSLLNTVASLTNKQLESQPIPILTNRKTHHLTKEKQQQKYIDSVIEKYKASKEGAVNEGQGHIESEGRNNVRRTEHEGEGTEELSPDEEWQSFVKKLENCPESAINTNGWSNFQEVFIVSALKDDNVDDLRDYILSCAKPGDWEYHSSIITSESPYKLAENIVWEKMMDYVEFPVYELHPKINNWEWDQNFDQLDISMEIKCPNKFIQAEVVKKVPTIVETARAELRNLFKYNVNLNLRVNVKK